MITVAHPPDDVEGPAEPGETILDAALRAGVPHAHACGGQALCSTCRTVVLAGAEHCAPRTPAEAAIAERLDFGPQTRLACQTRLLDAPPGARVVSRRVVLDDLDRQLVLDEGVKHPQPLPAGCERPSTLLFADIAGYTAFAGAHQPYDVAHAVSRYFAVMGGVVVAHGGRISDYYGDGFFAVFLGPTHARDGVAAARALWPALDRFNDGLDRLLGHRFRIRAGVHTGPVIAMTVGVEGMRKEAVIGDAVNVASRIEGANKTVGSRLLVSADTLNAALDQGAALHSSGEFRVAVRGKAEPLALYELGVEPDGPPEEPPDEPSATASR